MATQSLTIQSHLATTVLSCGPLRSSTAADTSSSSCTLHSASGHVTHHLNAFSADTTIYSLGRSSVIGGEVRFGGVAPPPCACASKNRQNVSRMIQTRQTHTASSIAFHDDDDDDDNHNHNNTAREQNGKVPLFARLTFPTTALLFVCSLEDLV